MRALLRVALEGCQIVAAAICAVLLQQVLRRIGALRGQTYRSDRYPESAFPLHEEDVRRPAFLPRTAD
jgi:hypothetical protein